MPLSLARAICLYAIRRGSASSSRTAATKTMETSWTYTATCRALFHVTPPASGRLMICHGALAFSLGGRYLSSRATDPFNYVKIGGFTTFDLAARYRREKVEYALNVTNFLNKTHYFVGAIDDQATQLYPGTPIDVSATVRYRF
jgi:hypothetical protein